MLIGGDWNFLGSPALRQSYEAPLPNQDNAYADHKGADEKKWTDVLKWIIELAIDDPTHFNA